MTEIISPIQRHSIGVRFMALLSLMAMPIGMQAIAQPAPPTRIEISQSSSTNAKLIREGAFLTDMRGELRRTQLGWVMDFAPDARTGERLVSMVLQGGMTLTAMEQIIAAHDEPIGFILSGQVFVYHDRNYLLPTRFAITTDIAPPQARADSERDQSESPESTVLPGFDDTENEPSVGDLLENIDTETTGGRDVPIPLTSGSSAKLREGKMIAQVRGRVLPGAGGDLVFTQDSDTDEDESELPPLRLMPCLNVERLEKLRMEWGDQLIVSMSGRIFVSAGRPALLPTMYVVELERAGNLTLGQ